MLREDFLGIIVNLHLPLADHSGPLKTEVNATDASEE
jgi:hypothetical protein